MLKLHQSYYIDSDVFDYLLLSINNKLWRLVQEKLLAL